MPKSIPKFTIRTEHVLAPKVVLDIITTVNDSQACNYWLLTTPKFLGAVWRYHMENDPSQWLNWEWRLLEDDGVLNGSDGVPHILTYTKVAEGLQKMLQAEQAGTYKNSYTRVGQVITGADYGDATFADHVIQFALFGEVIYG